ncbi:MAG: EAL domain-containing protein [Eggerthellaceae bacterium]
MDAVKLDRSLTEGLLAHASDSSVLASATADVDEVSAAEASSASAVPSSMSAAATSAPDTASEAVTSAADEAITSLINLVHEAGKIVVVEGVETLQQLEVCRDKGCDVVQGFFFSEPLLPESVLRYKPPKISL